MLERVGGHRSADELVLALRRGGYHHARTTVYNALDDLARAGLVVAAPVDAGALRYESAGPRHHHFVCRTCGAIHNVPLDAEVASRPMPDLHGHEPDEIDVVYRGRCEACASEATDDESQGAGAHRPEPFAMSGTVASPAGTGTGMDDDRAEGMGASAARFESMASPAVVDVRGV
jgi:Fe2+ or Zn2+ uptake regulation protein